MRADGPHLFGLEQARAHAVTDILQHAREGFLFRYRDFAVRNVSRLLESYRVISTGNVVTVAGRACDEVRFERLRAPRRT